MFHNSSPSEARPVSDTEPYKFDRTTELFTRATELIPRGIYGTRGPAMVIPGSYPLFATRGEGCRYWDVDGNEYIDYLCGFGSTILGFADPTVEKSVTNSQNLGVSLNHPTERMIELAQLLTELIDGVEWAVFGKNGSDMTNYALQIAREYTGRSKVLIAEEAYHGSYAWAIRGHRGIIEEDTRHVHRFIWNDAASVRNLLERHSGQVAAVMVTPYHHPAFADSELSQNGFLQELCKLANANGCLVISDDIRTGFRVALSGSHTTFGFQPDLVCYSKAIANGYPISACLGTKELKRAAGSVFCTGTFWMHEYPMAAAIACIGRLIETEALATMKARGEQLINGLHEVATIHGQQLKITGYPSMPFVRFANESDFMRNQLFCAEATRRGVYFHPHHNWFLTAAHTEDDIAQTLAIADRALHAVKERFGTA